MATKFKVEPVLTNDDPTLPTGQVRLLVLQDDVLVDAAELADIDDVHEYLDARWPNATSR